MLTITLCMCLAAQLASAQIAGYANVGNFSCDRTAELVTRQTETGTVMSPCYGLTYYPGELSSGVKLINISYDSPYVYGYRLAMRDFQIAPSDRLFVGEATTMVGGSTIANRNYSFSSSSRTDNRIYVQTVENGPIVRNMTLGTENVIDLENIQRLIMDFYTVDDTLNGRGFLIDYAVDINKCLFTGDNVHCKNSGICTRTGFNAASCDCNETGYEGPTCITEINECTAGTHKCSLDADCTNTDGGFTCSCKIGFAGNGFTCERDISCSGAAELVFRTTETGTVMSPCYNVSDYPKGLSSGRKLINISHDSAYVHGYRLTIRDFQIAPSDRLYVGEATTVSGVGATALRNYTFTSSSPTDNRIHVQTVDDGPIVRTMTLGTDNVIDLENFQSLFMDFYTVNDTVNGRGFLIDYVADINKCLFTGDDVHCKNSGICTRAGFNAASCNCNGTRYEGPTCNTDVNECTTGTHGCSALADCSNIEDGFTCICKTGFNGDGMACTDIDECAAGVHSCSSNANCTNTFGAFTCTCTSGFTGDGVTCSVDFSCNRAVELVSRTTETGTVKSPCYSVSDYPKELSSGMKLINISYDSPYVQGYRLTIRDFQIAPSDRLYVGEDTTVIGLRTTALRDYTFTSSSTTDNRIQVQTSEDGPIVRTMTLGTDNVIDLENFQRLIMDFYTVRDTVNGRGFLIDYAADLNKCLFTGDDVHCKNKGICTRTGFNAASCNCDGTGYEGPTCIIDVNECTTGNHGCSALADCSDIEGGFTCICKTGFTGNGSACTDIDECAAGLVNCSGNANCTNTVGAFTCTCNGGYTGDGFTCSDIDECVASTDICSVDATCTNTFGAFTCTCSSGFSGDGFSCVDIGECETKTDNCSINATCTNTVGAFTCTCNSGFSGDGVTCSVTTTKSTTTPEPTTLEPVSTTPPSTISSDVNECTTGTHNCHAQANCSNIVGGFTCTCKTGYTGNGSNCTDIDECATKTDNCSSNATCTNTLGAFTCTCNSGFGGDGFNCVDIDECTRNTDDCDVDARATCSNTAGSFTCACDPGYTGDGKACTDNNECFLNTDNCHADANCNNNAGSYTCDCKTGYTGDGRNCAEIHECTGSPCDADADCSNNPPGSFTCTCKNGFTGDGFSCTDNDECALNTDNCHANATCTNIKGSFTCACDTGYSGNGVTCADDDECTGGSNDCDVSTRAECTNTVGSFVCACKSGYTGDGKTCTDIDECTTGTHNCIASETRCNNIVGGFECICNSPRFRGTPGNCDYYCGHNETCIKDRAGFIEMPVFYNGTKTYPASDETHWTFQTSSTGNGIRFTLKSFSTEARDDFLSMYPGNSVNLSLEIISLSGSIGNLFNEKDSVSSSGYIQRTETGSDVPAYINLTGSEVTLTLDRSDIHLLFTSDRLNSSSGFVLAFEYDKNDCPAVSRCNNGGTCEDRAFAYQCVNCPGYEGTDCDLDIDECANNGCDPNATCANTVGSFTCECQTDFTGDGLNCNPLIVLGNYRVQSTLTTLSINFDITSRWRNPDYLVSFLIAIRRVGGGFTQIYNVSLTDLIAGPLVVSGLATYTEYSVTVTVNTTGSQYGSSVLRNDLGTQNFSTAESTPGIPKNLVFSSASRDRVTLTWVKPDEIGFGKVTHYEVCFAPSTSNTTQTIADLRSITKADMCMFLDDTYTTITLTNLPSYIDLDFKIRAYTSQGPGNFTSTVSAYTGTVCPTWTSTINVVCNALEGLLQSDGFPRDSVDSDNELISQEWSFNLTLYPRWRPNFKYFYIAGSNEAVLDFGYGDINIRIPGIESTSRTASYTGNLGSPGADPVAGFTKNTSIIAQNTLWFAFISDRTRKRPGFQVEIEIDGNSCLSSPCLHGGSCTDGQFSYTCDCTATNWRGAKCEIPHVQPTIACTPGRRNLDITFNDDRWGTDETVIGGYTVAISTGGTSVSSMSKAFGESTASFTSLTPFTDYQVSVNATGSIRTPVQPEAGVITCKTLEDVPTLPRSVVVSPGDKSLVVTWVAPSEPNGNVRYRMSWASTDHATFGETPQTGSTRDLAVTSYTISGLRDFRKYDVTVTAETSAGPTAADAVSGTTNPGAPPSFTAVTVTVLRNKSARVDWTFSPSVYVGPITMTVKPASSLHDAPAATESVNGSPYSPTTFTYASTLADDQTYNFTITASTGTAPDQTFLVTGVDTGAAVHAPPGNFGVLSNTQDAGITLTWDPTSAAVSYTIVGTPSVDSAFSITANTSIISIPTVLGITYNFTVWAVNKDGVAGDEAILENIDSAGLKEFTFEQTMNSSYTFSSDLQNQSSITFLQLKLFLENLYGTALRNVSGFQWVKVDGFFQGSIIARMTAATSDPNMSSKDFVDALKASPFGETFAGDPTSNVNECRNSNPSVCDSNASCLDTNGSYICTCNTGYFGDGKSCTDSNECTRSNLSPCHQDASCFNTLGSFRCSCNAGYVGNGTSCQDNDECANIVACGENQTCSNVDGSYACSCNAGFTGNVATQCIDIDECKDPPNRCGQNLLCHNTLGSFFCECESEFTRSGKLCVKVEVDIDECRANIDACTDQATCRNTIGSYLCVCKTGFTGSSNLCTDIDECESLPCAGTERCVNSVGSYSCECPGGYTQNGTLCQNIDECVVGTASCPPNRSCVDTDGSYECNCDTGLAGNDCSEGMNCSSCTDVNECAQGSDGCDKDANCTNTVGSFTCTCRQFFVGTGTNCTANFTRFTITQPSDKFSSRLARSAGEKATFLPEVKRLVEKLFPGFSCIHVEITGETGKSLIIEYVIETAMPLPTSVNISLYYASDDDDASVFLDRPVLKKSCVDLTCVNGYCFEYNNVETCGCIPGYSFSNDAGFTSDEKSCQDLDECSAETFICANNSDCKNTVGSFTCICRAGYKKTADGTCKGQCEDRFCSNGGICIASLTSDTPTCQCTGEFEGPKCEDSSLRLDLVIAFGGTGGLLMIALMAASVIYCAKREEEKTGIL